MRALLLVLALVGCANGAAEEAEDRYRFLTDNRGTNRDLCEAASEAAEEWTERGDPHKFEYWRSVREVRCMGAARAPGEIPPS